MSLSFPRLRRPAEDAEPLEAGSEPEPERTEPERTEPGRPGSRWQWVRQHVLPVVPPVLAVLVVYLALVGPDDFGNLTPLAFIGIPVEALVGAALFLVLPGRARRPVGIVLGVLLGLLAVLKIVDVAYFAFRDVPFDLVLDWPRLGDAAGVVRSSIGRPGELGLIAVLVLVIAAVLWFVTRSVLRLGTMVSRRDPVTLRVLGLLAVAWLVLAAFGAQLVPGVPVAARGTSALVYDRIQQVRAGIHDADRFAKLQAVDQFHDTPAAQLLPDLRGKDVLFTFVESYGRSAIEDPKLDANTIPLLDAGTSELTAAGFSMRSGFLTSSTAGGGSWLAHSTLFSGLWVNNQQRYSTLVHSHRLTLPGAFNKAGWRTVSYEPAIQGYWPEVGFYHYDKGYDRPSIDYHGPQFSYAPIPDQYTFSQLHKDELGPGHQPVMAELTLVSSHTPFTPRPTLLPWDQLGNGSVYSQDAAEQGGPASSVLTNSSAFKAAYAGSIQYTLSTVISYLKTYATQNTVMVFLGDHQASPVIVGRHASRDVPITIVAKDPAVLAKVNSWNWTSALRPDPNAPVWTMDQFRDRFLAAFGSTPEPPQSLGR